MLPNAGTYNFVHEGFPQRDYCGFNVPFHLRRDDAPVYGDGLLRVRVAGDVLHFSLSWNTIVLPAPQKHLIDHNVSTSSTVKGRIPCTTQAGTGSSGTSEGRNNAD